MKLRLVAAVGLSAALLLTACSDENGGASPEPTTETTTEVSTEETPGGEETESAGGELSGSISGMGASSMRVAQDAWIAAFASQTGVQVSYAAEGSGAGRDAMGDGSANFAGSDRAFRIDENVAGSFGSCSADSIIYNLPVYISPIAVVFNLDGVESLNLDPATISAIFKGEIAQWNDPAIAEHNPDVDLPDEFITVVYRQDNSGTTENLSDYLHANAPEVWDAEPSGDWPYSEGQGASQTDGVINAVTSGNGTIGYVDYSAAQGVSIVQIGSDGQYFGPDGEAAAAAVENSPLEEGREEHDLAIEIDRTAEGYGAVLVAYALVCAEYDDENTADLVKAYMAWISSEEGQEMAQAQAGSAPLSEALREQVQASIDAINS